LTKQTVIY